MQIILCVLFFLLHRQCLLHPLQRCFHIQTMKLMYQKKILLHHLLNLPLPASTPIANCRKSIHECIQCHDCSHLHQWQEKFHRWTLTLKFQKTLVILFHIMYFLSYSKCQFHHCKRKCVHDQSSYHFRQSSWPLQLRCGHRQTYLRIPLLCGLPLILPLCHHLIVSNSM